MFFIILRIILIAACCVPAGAFSMHMLQLQRYQTTELARFQRKHADRLLLADVIIAAAAALLNWYLPMLLAMVIQKEALRTQLCLWITLALFLLSVLLLFFYRRHFPMKKPFGVTRRICRLMALCFILGAAGATVLQLLKLSPYFIFAAADLIVLLAARILQPLENRINQRFIRSAREKLAANPELICIGITGSYGKTDVKLMLKTILSEEFSVLATPASFSTILGITRTINEQLKPSHQLFIAEMGAQRKGEIREMAKLLKPRYGAITCIGAAHLESFGSIEATAQAKYELIQCLPENGEAFFGSDASYGDRLFHMCKKDKFRAGIGSDVDHYMRAEHIETGICGTRLQLICADGSSCWLQTKLLGESHVRNLVLSAAIARRLGLGMEQIAKGAEKLKPRSHQLQGIPGSIHIVDNGGNSLPAGAEEALRVLADLPGRRILVTAGLSEPEGKLSESNFAFGTQVPGRADFALLVAPEDGDDEDLAPLRAMMNGMSSAKFPKGSVRMVRGAEDAAAILAEIAGEGDTILFEGGSLYELMYAGDPDDE